MIVLTNIFPKREHICFLVNNIDFKFKGKTWKTLGISVNKNIFYLEIDGMKFYLRIMGDFLRLEMGEARGYNNKYIESFKNSFLDSLDKRPSICEDCIYKFQYKISRQCNHLYKKSTLVEKPEE